MFKGVLGAHGYSGVPRVASEGLNHAGFSLAGANPTFKQNSKSKICFDLTLMGHQNIKTSLCNLSKNG